MKIPWNTRLGIIGESEVKKRLSYFSIVNKYQTEVGIDFICELCERDVPSRMYFFVQAKGTRHFDERWGRSFEKKTIISWLNQPHPVFLVVYDEINRECYWMSIIEQFSKNWSKKMGTDSKTIYVKMDRSNVLEEGENRNSVFIGKIKESSALINLIRGRPQFLGEGYVKRRPIVYLSNGSMVNIKANIRISMLYLITHYLLSNNIETAYLLCDFLTKFDKSHYDHFVLFGRINKFLGKREEAKKSFEEAIKICKRDKRWNALKAPSDPSIEDLVASIEKEMKSL